MYACIYARVQEQSEAIPPSECVNVGSASSKQISEGTDRGSLARAVERV